MSVHVLLAKANPIASRLPWMRQETGVISVRIENGDLDKAAATLDSFAKANGLKIAEVGRVMADGAEAAFARVA